MTNIERGESKSSPWRIFTYKELHAATNGFGEDYKLGEGGFGSVYWGKTSDGLQIAVKKLKSMNSKAEMELRWKLRCLGDLLSHLHGQFAAEVQLDWKKRMKIALGSAEGLFRFSFAKLIPEGVSHMTTSVKGTLGYLAPEYAMWGKVSESCGVYSRILLLEIVTGRKPIEKLPASGNFDENQLIQTINVAALCVQNEADKRPTMKEVVALLKGEAFNDKGSNMRIKSVKYGEDLMALDQESDDEDGKNGYEDESSVYGVFGALETQRMQDPYRHYGNRR
ncbi:hypothetical protein DH2020_034318 [Rehmannia glutinosa]|uniref:Protein kinase domain-containing protein n=1 Tax=Rehmannia glutinosa TaxID=99300 RepID=A0ABR0VCT0_REHGL